VKEMLKLAFITLVLVTPLGYPLVVAWNFRKHLISEFRENLKALHLATEGQRNTGTCRENGDDKGDNKKAAHWRLVHSEIR
jgi:hypothetical protein